MIDSSEKCNRQLALNFRIRMFVKSTVSSMKLSELQFIWSTMIFNKSKLKILSQIIGLFSS